MQGQVARNGDKYTITTEHNGNYTMLCSFTEDGACLPDGTVTSNYLHLIGHNTDYR